MAFLTWKKLEGKGSVCFARKLRIYSGGSWFSRTNRQRWFCLCVEILFLLPRQWDKKKNHWRVKTMAWTGIMNQDKGVFISFSSPAFGHSHKGLKVTSSALQPSLLWFFALRYNEGWKESLWKESPFLLLHLCNPHERLILLDIL